MKENIGKVLSLLERERARHERRKQAFLDGGNLLLAASMEIREETVNEFIALIKKI